MSVCGGEVLLRAAHEARWDDVPAVSINSLLSRLIFQGKKSISSSPLFTSLNLKTKQLFEAFSEQHKVVGEVTKPPTGLA